MTDLKSHLRDWASRHAAASDVCAEALAEIERLEAELDEERRDYGAVCEALECVDSAEGHGPVYPDADTVCVAIREMRRELNDYSDVRIERERDAWHEEDGPVLWWKFPVVEPPYAGTPLDDDFPEYVTHWTRVQTPFGWSEVQP
jgi:hypothetical protein